MAFLSSNCKCSCTAAAVIVSAIIGVITAFLQITGVITVTTAFLWVVFGIAVVYLGVLTAAAVLASRREGAGCCTVLSSVLAGILGTILFAVILLAVGIIATSVVSAILVGLLLFFFALTLASSACYVRCLSDCAS